MSRNIIMEKKEEKKEESSKGINIQCPPHIHRRLKLIAELNQTTIVEEVLSLIERYVNSYDIMGDLKKILNEKIPPGKELKKHGKEINQDVKPKNT